MFGNCLICFQQVGEIDDRTGQIISYTHFELSWSHPKSDGSETVGLATEEFLHRSRYKVSTKYLQDACGWTSYTNDEIEDIGT